VTIRSNGCGCSVGGAQPDPAQAGIQTKYADMLGPRFRAACLASCVSRTMGDVRRRPLIAASKQCAGRSSPQFCEMKPVVSVVMPVRDGSRWLREAICSLRLQTFDALEIVIVDDGSADESPHIINTSAQSDSRIRAFRQERLGLVAALNRGISESRGDLIARLDADDLATPDRLLRQIDFLERHREVGLLGTWAVQIDECGRDNGRREPPTDSEQLSALLQRTNPFLHSSIVIRRSLLQKVGPYRPALEGAEDYDLWIRISEHAKVANLAEHLLQYRVHRDNATPRARVRQLFSTRLAQISAAARRSGRSDPIDQLSGPADWRDAKFLRSPLWADVAGLYRFLELADPAVMANTTDDDVQIAAIANPKITLTHAERRLAQLALMNLVRRRSTRLSRSALLWQLVRLHPLRAVRLCSQAFHDALTRK